MNLYFGWRTALLLLLSVQMLILALALTRQPVNRTANRILAAWLIVATGVLTPYTIGFAGVYDAWMNLTFAPFALTLFLAPLLYGYTHALVTGLTPDRWRLHLLPGLAQLAYMTAAFLLPFPLKMRWDEQGDGPWVSPLISAGVLVGLIAYSVAALRLLAAHRRALAEQRSDDDLYAARWLGRVLAAMIGIAGVWTGWCVWLLARGRFDYFEFFGLHLLIGLIGVFLAVEGWRNAALKFAPPPAEPSFPPMPASSPALEPDWKAIGLDLETRTREAGWWREPELSLPQLARRLGLNSGRVSRAVNLGLGMNFSAFINGLRAEGVAAGLVERPSSDLLDLAFEMGFASKASFNRAFRARFGMTPSQYRAQHRGHHRAQHQADHRADHREPASDVSDPVFSSETPKLRRAKS